MTNEFFIHEFSIIQEDLKLIKTNNKREMEKILIRIDMLQRLFEFEEKEIEKIGESFKIFDDL